jgi:hypothetical protein
MAAAPSMTSSPLRTMKGYATLAQLGQRRLSYRTLLPFLLLLAYVFMESLLRVNMLMSQQDMESRRTFGGELLGLASLSSSKVPMHVCRAGNQILSMPAKVPGFLIVSRPGSKTGGRRAIGDGHSCDTSRQRVCFTHLFGFLAGRSTKRRNDCLIYTTQHADRCYGIGGPRNTFL